MMNNLSMLLLPLLMMFAAATDIASMRIPNWLTGLIAALFFPMAYLTGMPMDEFGLHMKAGIILFFVGFMFFSLRLFGGGDAKLMAAAGLWFGSEDMMPFLVNTALAGGVLALFYAGWSAALAFKQAQNNDQRSFRQILRSVAPKMPYGCALAVGAILAFPQSWWVEMGTSLSKAAV
jgi:prepilin peptidase CpaA